MIIWWFCQIFCLVLFFPLLVVNNQLLNINLCVFERNVLTVKKKLLLQFEYIVITCMFWSRKYIIWQYKANAIVGFERMILARLMVCLMLVSIPVTIDYLLHVTSILTTKVLHWKNYRYKWYIVNLCLGHDHKHMLL